MRLREIDEFIEQLEALRWTGRSGYGARALVALCLANIVHERKAFTRIAAAMQTCIRAVPAELGRLDNDYGKDSAIDSTRCWHTPTAEVRASRRHDADCLLGSRCVVG